MKQQNPANLISQVFNSYIESFSWKIYAFVTVSSFTQLISLIGALTISQTLQTTPQQAQQPPSSNSLELMSFDLSPSVLGLKVSMQSKY